MRVRIPVYAAVALGAAGLAASFVAVQAPSGAGTAVTAARVAPAGHGSPPRTLRHAPPPRHSPSPSPTKTSPSPTKSPTPTPTPTSPSPTPTPTGGSPGATVPYAAALQSGHPLVQQFNPATLAGSGWNSPANDPGNCAANPKAVSLNSSGYAELDTTGAANNCVSIQSPTTLPTTAGYVYEADVYISNFQDWPAFWMYGNNWPAQGEIDAVEANFGANYVSWHYAACSRSAGDSEISTNPWTYACKSTVSPVGANIQPGWHVVDIAWTSSGVQVYYDGSLYVTISESVTTGRTADPMWLTLSEGSCEANGNNECASGALGTPGNVQVKYVRQFS
jgi:hypothetical protein